MNKKINFILQYGSKDLNNNPHWSAWEYIDNETEAINNLAIYRKIRPAFKFRLVKQETSFTIMDN